MKAEDVYPGYLSAVDELKEAVSALLRESPLLQNVPSDGTVTSRLIKRVMKAIALITYRQNT